LRASAAALSHAGAEQVGLYAVASTPTNVASSMSASAGATSPHSRRGRRGHLELVGRQAAA
jgi:hypothetical protein